MKTTLYAKDSKGKLRVWSIWSEDKQICMEYGTEDGETITNSEPVLFGLANRTPEEQIQMRINSRVNKKKDAGYTESRDDALSNKRTNTLGYPRPMNAKAITNKRQVPNEWFIQFKYNGHRCMIINDSGNIVSYSKGGKLIETIPEILEEVRDLPEGIVLDGELYKHGVPLQTISSWVRRRQPDTLKLKFKCFDANIDGLTFRERNKFLKGLDFLSGKGRCKYVRTRFVKGEFDVEKYFVESLKKKYEGLMLKNPDALYQDGKRSSDVLKVKKRSLGKKFIIDDEFLVVNIKASKDKWAILVCETEQGIQFSVSCPGDVPEKTRVLKNKDYYIGKHVRVEFEGYTKGKKPVEAVAIDWREKQNE